VLVVVYFLTSQEGPLSEEIDGQLVFLFVYKSCFFSTDSEIFYTIPVTSSSQASISSSATFREQSAGYMYTCVCIYIYIYIYICTPTHTHTHKVFRFSVIICIGQVNMFWIARYNVYINKKLRVGVLEQVYP
jgi:hypothetical protein